MNSTILCTVLGGSNLLYMMLCISVVDLPMYMLGDDTVCVGTDGR